VVSQLKVNEIIKQSGSTLTIGQDGDTVSGPFTNVPSFFVNKTSNQTLTDNTYTKITFDTEVYDTDSAYTSDKFTVPSGKGGKYYIGTVLFTDTDASSNYEYGDIKFYLNGSEISQHIHDVRNNAGNQFSLATQIIFNLSVGDYIEVYCRINDLSGSPNVAGSSNYISYFYGYRIIGA